MTTAFVPQRCFDDIRTTAAAIDAPFSAPVTARVLETFADHFAAGAVLWKTTDRPGDGLCYRFYAARRSDTIGVALRAGMLDGGHAMIDLVRSWSALYGGAPEQSCDFDARRGLVKTWLYLGGTRPLGDILGAAHVPDTVRQHEAAWRAAGLAHVRFASVDYHHDTVNIYFRAPGPITAAQAAAITALARTAAPPPDQLAELSELLPRGGFTVAVTVSAETGGVSRVCFYAPMLRRLPPVGERLRRFFAQAPCLDREVANVAAWSYGPAGGTYLKAERGYCGDLAATFRRWATFSSGDDQVDPKLGHPRPPAHAAPRGW